MTSAKASIARQQLAYALGENRIRLSELRPKEFDELLHNTLREIDLRELRGFQPLKDLISRSPGSQVFGPGAPRRDPCETVRVIEAAVLSVPFPFSGEQPVSLSSHMIQVSRGAVNWGTTWRRHESGEETTDRQTAHEWGRGCYVHAEHRTILTLRRPPNGGSAADQNLFEVWYRYVKVLYQDEMAVVEVRVTRVPLEGLRSRYQECYPEIGRNLIWEMNILAERTLGDLKFQVERFAETIAKIHRLAESISE